MPFQSPVILLKEFAKNEKLVHYWRQKLLAPFNKNAWGLIEYKNPLFFDIRDLDHRYRSLPQLHPHHCQRQSLCHFQYHHRQLGNQHHRRGIPTD